MKKTKHLLIFSYDYPPSDGGIARLCQEIASGMHPYYGSVKVLTVEKKGISKPYNYDKVEVVKLPSQRFLCELMAWWYLFKLPYKSETDVLCGLWHPEASLCLLAGLKNVYILGHGTEFLAGASRFRKMFWLPFYARWVLSNVRKIITNSHYTLGLVKKISSKAKIVALPLAVNHHYFSPSGENKGNEKLQLCTVSRVLQFKGHDFIAKTIASLPDKIKQNTHWNIAGTGAYLQELKQLVSALEISHLVTFKGFVPDDELVKCYNDNDVFILCTRENDNSTSVEGFGLVFLEAQACGIPAIGTRTGGIPDAVKENQGGWLIEQDNTVQLAQLLSELVEDRQKAAQMGKIARQRVEQDCTWQQYCAKLNDELR